MDVLDAADASFVSVTQSFKAATSMGRLTLNMLRNFAQFEREVTAERIRDKIAASKRKGLWMGGQVPLGYDADGRTLAINEKEAVIIDILYRLYEESGTVRVMKEEPKKLCLRGREREGSDGTRTGGNPFDRGHIHHLLTNPIYAGRIRHRDKVFEGQHPAIIAPERWTRIQQQLQEGAARGREFRASRQRSLLYGKLFDETGDRFTPSHTKTRKGIWLRYYISHRLVARNGEQMDAWRLPEPEFEEKVAQLTRGMISATGFASKLNPNAAAGRIRLAAKAFAELANQKWASSVLDLIARIDIAPGRLTLQLNGDAIAKAIDVDADGLATDALGATFPFQLRKRGSRQRSFLPMARLASTTSSYATSLEPASGSTGSGRAKPLPGSQKPKPLPSAASSR